mgnify:CR=1 FL=1
MPPAWADPCNGHFTHDLARGKCPIEIAAANRVVNGGRRTATLGGILPNSLQDAVTTNDLAYLNTVDHTVDVGFDFGNATIQGLFDAAKSELRPECKTPENCKKGDFGGVKDQGVSLQNRKRL